MNKAIFVALSLVLLSACSGPVKDSCTKTVRTVIDLGSGSTKLTTAEVEKCEGPADSGAKLTKVLRVLDDKTSDALALEAGKNRKGEIPTELQEKSIDTLLKLQEKAKETAVAEGYQQMDVAVVGTHAFRTAANLPEFKNRIEIKGFHVFPLTQGEEAMIGATAVRALPVAKSCSPLFLWDVGGGSAQFSFDQENETTSVGIPVGAESFKQELILAQKKGLKKPKHSCALSAKTPNPVGAKNYTKALLAARKLADKQIDQLPVKSSCAIGIGGVHRKAIAEQIEKKWDKISVCVCEGANPECKPNSALYTRKELQCLATYLSDKSDCDEEIKSPYSDTAVSNLYMVLAFMDKLGIDRIYTASVNMGHALVVDDKNINFKTIPTSPAPQE